MSTIMRHTTNNLAEPEHDAGDGYRWFAVLGECISLPVEAGERVAALEDDMLEGDADIEFYCDRPPSLTDRETQQALEDLLAKEEEHELDHRYAKLRGGTLELPSGGSVVESEVGGAARITRTSEMWYRLVVTDGEVPVGFCTWALELSGNAAGTMPEVPVVVEIGEVWLAPEYRGLGIGRAMADRVVHLLAQTLLELDGRLSANVAGLVSVEIEVGADVYSDSGADFICRVARIAKEQLTSVLGAYYGELLNLAILAVHRDPRR